MTNTYFTLLCLFYAVMDLTGKPAFLTRYRIQENEKVMVASTGCVGINVLSFPD